MSTPTGLAMTDGGIETVLVYHEGIDLPDFAAFPLLYKPKGRAALQRYFETFLDLAERTGLPFVIGTPTWRANRDWGERLGYSEADLVTANTDAVAFVREVVAGRMDVVVEGVLGPRGDAYLVSNRMHADEAAEYHDAQIAALKDAGADRVTALTLTYPDEAVGVIRAARARDIPVVVSFTVETDGHLPDGTTLADAIAQVDEATDSAALFFMVNCAHPTHIALGLEGAASTARIGGIRVNASKRSHAELDVATELDEGDPAELARDHAALRSALSNVQVLGGCCGTDARHVGEIIAAWRR